MKTHFVSLAACFFGVSWMLGVLVVQTSAQDPQPDKQPGPFLANLLETAKPLEIADDEDELQKLLKRRLNVAIEEFREHHTGYQSGTSEPHELFDAADRLYEAAISLAATPADRVTIIQRHLTALNEFHAGLATLVDSGVHRPADLRQLEFHRLTLEIDLLKAKKEAGQE